MIHPAEVVLLIALTVGGGIRSVQDVEEVLRAGADKVTVNSAVVRNPELITAIARTFGSQCVVAAIEVKLESPGNWRVLIENGREATGLNALDWARQCYELGAGEILLTSIDMDGTRRGCDITLTRAVAEWLPIPVIASGGPGNIGHVVTAFQDGRADAIALGTLLHFNLADVRSLKEMLLQTEVDVRPIVNDRKSAITALAI